MRNDFNHRRDGNFWFGLLLGLAAGGAGLFFVGTKKGRKILKNVIETAEDWEDSILELTGQLEKKFSKEKESLKESIDHISSTTHIDSVLEKIKSVMPEKKEVKKYFTRDGKIIK